MTTTASVECAICMEPVAVKNMCVTPCGHTFCFSDLMTWLNQNDQCPCCREGLIPETADDEEEEDEEDATDEGWFSDEEGGGGDGDGDASNTMPAVDLDVFAERFEAAGYSLTDALALLLDDYTSQTRRYTRAYISEIMLKMEELEEELLNESSVPSTTTIEAPSTQREEGDGIDSGEPEKELIERACQDGSTESFEEAVREWKMVRMERRYADEER